MCQSGCDLGVITRGGVGWASSLHRSVEVVTDLGGVRRRRGWRGGARRLPGARYHSRWHHTRRHHPRRHHPWGHPTWGHPFRPAHPRRHHHTGRHHAWRHFPVRRHHARRHHARRHHHAWRHFPVRRHHARRHHARRHHHPRRHFPVRRHHTGRHRSRGHHARWHHPWWHTLTSLALALGRLRLHHHLLHHHLLLHSLFLLLHHMLLHPDEVLVKHRPRPVRVPPLQVLDCQPLLLVDIQLLAHAAEVLGVSREPGELPPGHQYLLGGVRSVRSLQSKTEVLAHPLAQHAPQVTAFHVRLGPLEKTAPPPGECIVGAGPARPVEGTARDLHRGEDNVLDDPQNARDPPLCRGTAEEKAPQGTTCRGESNVITLLNCGGEGGGDSLPD
eukprot:Hpha_TRINITY_DN8757_c0_g1::TRINITY_DN8757_c0_g1_i3::g.45210::m.45210